MNMRREAILWSMAVAAAIALGLAVVWAAIAVAFSRPNLAPLYFSSAPYRQDDYSAESADAARLSPLDPNLEQEVILDDQARGDSAFKVIYLQPVIQAGQTATPASTGMPFATPTNTPAPALTNTPPPASKDTAVPAPTNTPAPAPTNTRPPASKDTPVPAPTNISPPTPANTSLPAPTRTSVAPKPTKTSKPTKTPDPTRTPDGDRGPGHNP